MNLRKFFIAIFIIVATSMLALFIFEILNNFDSIVNFNSQNDLVFNNQLSSRDVKKVITSVISENSTNSTNIPDQVIRDPAASWIVAITLIGGLVFIGFLSVGVVYCLAPRKIGTANESVEMVVLD